MDQSEERIGRKPREQRVAHGVDGGRARLAGQQRHLAKRLARADLVQRPGAVEDAQSAADHDVGGVARIAAAEQGLAAGERDPFGVRLDLGENRRIGRVEQAGEMLCEPGVPERLLHGGGAAARSEGDAPLEMAKRPV